MQIPRNWLGLLLGGLLMVEKGYAVVVFSDNFEYEVGRDITNAEVYFRAHGWGGVKANNSHYGRGSGYIYTQWDATRQSRVLVIESLPTTSPPPEPGFPYRQTDHWISYGDETASPSTIPANVWIQFWLYATPESQFYTAKFIYPCRGPYPCTTEYFAWLWGWHNGCGTEGNYRQAQVGEWFWIFRAPLANNQAVPEWDRDKLYQNLGCLPLRRGQWYQFRIHVDTSGPQGAYELWRREAGQPTWTKLAEWLGGVTPQFTWPIPEAERVGQRVFRMPTTVNAVDSTVYLDDFIMATSVEDLEGGGGITCPGPIIRLVCTNGVVVHYKATASDNCSAPVTVTCTPPSGSFFPVGTTLVTCTATDACGNTSSCTFPVTVINSPFAFWFTLPRGWPDCYAQPTEPAVPGPCLTTAYGTGFWKNFDDPTVNRRVGVTWNFPLGWNILGATLQTRLRPPLNGCAGGSANDSISLGLTNCSPPAWLWSRYLGSGNPSAGLFPFQWCSGSGCNFNLNLNLAALPLAPSGTVNLLPHMNTTHRLDLFVQDDTTVDFARLRVRRCVPVWVVPVGGLDTTLHNARVVHGPDLWTLAPEEANAPFGAEFALGQAQGLLVLIEPLALADHPGAHLEFETLDAEGAPGIGFRLEAGDAGQGRVILSRLPAGITNRQVELILERNGVVIEQLPPKPFNAGDLLATFELADPLIEVGVLDGRELRASALSQEEDGSTSAYTLRARLCCDDNAGESDGRWSGARLMASGLPELPLQTPGVQLRSIEKKDIRRGPVVAKPGYAPLLLMAQDDQVVVTPLDDQTGQADLRITFPPTDEFAARVPGLFDLTAEEPLQPFQTNGTLKTQKQWLRIKFQTGVEEDLCLTEFVQGTNGLWTLTLPEVGQPNEGQVQQVLLKGPAGQTSIVPQPGPSDGLLLGQCSELPPTRAARLSNPQERVLISRLIWPQPVLFQAADGSSVQTVALEIHWRMPGDDGGLTGLGLENTGTDTLAVGGLEFGPQTRGLHVVIRDADEDGRPDAIEVQSDADGGVLEEAPTIQGPWTPVPDQFEQGVGRYTIPLPLQASARSARFFRVRY